MLELKMLSHYLLSELRDRLPNWLMILLTGWKKNPLHQHSLRLVDIKKGMTIHAYHDGKLYDTWKVESNPYRMDNIWWVVDSHSTINGEEVKAILLLDAVGIIPEWGEFKDAYSLSD